MPEEFWGAGGELPPVADSSTIKVYDHGENSLYAPVGKRYAVIDLDPETSDRYWASRAPEERERFSGIVRRYAHSKDESGRFPEPRRVR
jgi:hypothetical protein